MNIFSIIFTLNMQHGSTKDLKIDFQNNKNAKMQLVITFTLYLYFSFLAYNQNMLSEKHLGLSKFKYQCINITYLV